MTHERKRVADLVGKQPQWKPRPELLLCPGIPKPLHTVAPREILGRDWWDATREAAYKSTGYHCAACGVSKYAAREHQWLEGHEVYEVDWLLGRMEYKETVPLCWCCHNYIHLGRLEALLGKGQVGRKQYNIVVNHGNKVLREAGLVRTVPNEPTVPWLDWRLVLFGKEYPPIFKSYEQWKAAFNKPVQRKRKGK